MSHLEGPLEKDVDMAQGLYWWMDWQCEALMCLCVPRVCGGASL